LSEAGGLKTKPNRKGAKDAKVNYAFSIGVADGERTMSKMLNSYKFFTVKIHSFRLYFSCQGVLHWMGGAT